MWFGLAVGYAYHYGFFSRIEMGAAKATVLEKKWPFKSIAEKPYFVTAGNAMGGQIYNGFGSFMNRGGST